MRHVRRRNRGKALCLVLSLVVMAPPPSTPAAPVTTTAVQRNVAAKRAQRKQGARYRFGAAGPRRFDCSGLVVFAFKKAHRPLSVRTARQMWHLGRRIRRSQLRRGDIVFTWNRNHVGLYLGHGKYVHAPGKRRRVVVEALPKRGHGFVGAVRP